MKKLKMQTINKIEDNIDKLAELFPHCITEGFNEEGEITKLIDFDLFRQELSYQLVDGPRERYQINWPGKREALVSSNTSINKTLRPNRQESVDFNTTENLYIEGDNLDALKLLQESYLNKIKVIYIDPPYNTGKDFIYKDNRISNQKEHDVKSEQKNESGGLLVTNPDTDGRFHSNWLTMIYPRLKLAKNLLKVNGVIFISISEEEVENLKKVCNELFGEENFRNCFITRRHDKNINTQFAANGLKTLNVGFEYILCYAKSDKFLFRATYKEASEERKSKGYWKGFWNDADRPTMRYDILGFKPDNGQWKWKKETAEEAIVNYQVYTENFENSMSLEEYWLSTGKTKKFIRRNMNGKGKNKGVENWIAPSEGIMRNTNLLDILATQNIPEIKDLFDYPKNIELLTTLLELANLSNDDIVLDFFSGSATTAHAVIKKNLEDKSNIKFIMVQLPEEINEKTKAYQAGFKTITEIGKERIRRAGKKIKEENADKEGIEDLDTGFRVLKIDSSNMKDVYYAPDEMTQANLFDTVDNIKEGRSAEDLLFQVLLDWGVDLSLPIKREEIQGKIVYFVDEDTLAACFEENLDEAFVKELAKREVMRVVFKDSGFAKDDIKSNVEQIFKQLSPETEVKAI